MNTITTPALARTDGPQPSGGNQPTDRGERLLSASGVRAAGFVISALAVTHAALFFGFVGDWYSPAARLLVGLGGYALQLAMVGVLLVMWRTRAVGDGIGWRLAGAIVTVLTVAALGCGILHQLMPESTSVKDLSNIFMLSALTGFYAVSIAVVAQGRWHGFLRFVPIVGSSWGPAVVIAIMLGSEESSWWTFMVCLSASALIGGLSLVVRPDLAVAPAAAR